MIVRPQLRPRELCTCVRRTTGIATTTMDGISSDRRRDNASFGGGRNAHHLDLNSGNLKVSVNNDMISKSARRVPVAVVIRLNTYYIDSP